MGIGRPEDFLLRVPAWRLLAGAHTAVAAAMPCPRWASHGRPEILTYFVPWWPAKVNYGEPQPSQLVRMETHLVSDSNCSTANL